jgi:uncharacterized membrane protein YebE (DUF533 family)
MSAPPPSQPFPIQGPDATTLAVVQALVAKHRAEGMADLEIRRKILDELRAALPEQAVEGFAWETTVAGWQRAIEEVMPESQ